MQECSLPRLTRYHDKRGISAPSYVNCINIIISSLCELRNEVWQYGYICVINQTLKHKTKNGITNVVFRNNLYNYTAHKLSLHLIMYHACLIKAPSVTTLYFL